MSSFPKPCHQHGPGTRGSQAPWQPDHAHVPTLEHLDKRIPVVASPNAAKVVRGLGYQQIEILTHGKSLKIESLKIQAVPGSLVGPNLVENGYLLTDLTDKATLYYEPHGTHSAALKEYAPVDVIITPLTDLEIPLVGSVIKGLDSAINAVEWLQPQVILPTAAGGNVVFEGLLLALLRGRGDVNEFRSMLAQRNLSTRVIEAKPSDRVEVKLVDRATVS